MIAPDVNILVYAHRPDEVHHAAYREWFEDLVNDDAPFALSVLVAVGFVRIVTNRRVFREPTPISLALAIVDELRGRANCRVIAPGESHLHRVSELCRETSASGKLVADAQHAAIAIEHGCTWASRDADFFCFEALGLRFRHLSLA